MIEQGVVVAVDKDFVTVRIGRNSACSSCGKCGMTENQKHVDVFAVNLTNCEVNDLVKIEIPEANTTKLAFVAYGIPLLPAILLLLLSLLLCFPDWASILMFFGGFVLGFLVVCLIDKSKKSKWAKQPTVIDIISKNNVK